MTLLLDKLNSKMSGTKDEQTLSKRIGYVHNASKKILEKLLGTEINSASLKNLLGNEFNDIALERIWKQDVIWAKINEQRAEQIAKQNQELANNASENSEKQINENKSEENIREGSEARQNLMGSFVSANSDNFEEMSESIYESMSQGEGDIRLDLNEPNRSAISQKDVKIQDQYSSLNLPPGDMSRISRSGDESMIS